MEWFDQYFFFLAKAVTVLVVVLLIVLVIAASKDRTRRSEGSLSVVRVNDRFSRMSERLSHAVLSKSARKAQEKQRKQEAKAKAKDAASDAKGRLYVLNFHGDIKASALENLRHEVTAVLDLARPQDEILVRLESGGGMVHAYGLAASQLVRIREAGIPLTIAVDKVAASGGYMMACIADRILVAPFAMLGSIGVVAQLPNFNRLLKKHDVDFEMLTAGEYKRTLTVFGENSDKAREKFQEDLENIHQLFKRFVSRYRPALDIEAVATGEVWFGSEALDKHLADEVKTSDQYLSERVRQADVFELNYEQRKRLQDRLAGGMANAADRLLLTWASRFNNQRFW
ncbi:protease SohB [Halopseudomonas sabulinigri]|uniref:Serine protease SohB n=1 Tax=Halopseudomonas sabulinigri TaxID=472181 RepID=A0A1H1P5B6_9GAMM|nr:protease SohB [Halopseudomonas sabulinigri]SDS06185.1 serine protease SohB [Halopseudomonas sabulinigri]